MMCAAPPAAARRNGTTRRVDFIQVNGVDGEQWMEYACAQVGVARFKLTECAGCACAASELDMAALLKPVHTWSLRIRRVTDRQKVR